MTAPEIDTDGAGDSGAAAPDTAGTDMDLRSCVDRVVFADLLAEIGADDELSDGLIRTYLGDAELRMTELMEGARSGDTDAVARAAHGLRSGSALLGALDLAGLLLETEAAVRAGSCNLEAAGGEIEAEYRRVVAALGLMLVSA